MQKWFPSLQRMLADSDSDKDEEEEEKDMEEDDQDLDAQLPSFEFRFETAKLLIELDTTLRTLPEDVLNAQRAKYC